MSRKRDRYKATAQTYRGAARQSLDTVNAFRRAHAMPELTSISNVDPARPGSDRTYMLSLGQPQGHSFFEMDFANAEMRVLAHPDVESHLVQQLTRAHAEYMDRVMRGEPGTIYSRPRLYGSRSGRVSSVDHEARDITTLANRSTRTVRNFGVQAQNAQRALSDFGDALRNAFSPELDRLSREMLMPIRSLDDIVAALNGSHADPTAPAKPPEKPPHPDAGKIVERKRKMRRTLLGAEIADYREASGGVARVAQSELDPIKHVNRRKRP